MPSIVVTGSRSWTDAETIRSVLLPYVEYTLHVGDARGVDALAVEAFRALGGHGRRYVAHWRAAGHYNPRAGFERNTRMLIAAEPEVVLAFRMHGKSNGTDHCIAEAERLGYPVRIIRP